MVIKQGDKFIGRSTVYKLEILKVKYIKIFEAYVDCRIVWEDKTVTTHEDIEMSTIEGFIATNGLRQVSDEWD